MQFINEFNWDDGILSCDKPLSDLKDKCISVLSTCDEDVKVRQTFHSDKKNELSIIERGDAGSLMTRDLTEILSKCNNSDFINTRFLKTLVVVINKNYQKDIMKK